MILKLPSNSILISNILETFDVKIFVRHQANTHEIVPRSFHLCNSPMYASKVIT